MRLHEHEAKALFAEWGIAVPDGEVVASPAAAAAAARRIGGRTVVKAQVLAGGRAKAGGIRLAASPEAAAAAAGELLQRPIRGLAARAVLVESWVPAAAQLYLGVTIDPAAGCPVAMLSREGGTEIETLACQRPAAIARRLIDPCGTLAPDEASSLAGAAGLDAGMAAVAGLLVRLYELFRAEQALMVEINPLAWLADGRLCALDAVVELDDAVPDRRAGWEPAARLEDDRARAARQLGMTFVDLGPGEIGLICSGAGLGMATVDLIARAGARAANFLETGGGLTRELMAQAMRLVLSQPSVRALLINLYGGINPIHDAARGVADVLAEGPGIPVVAKALGNRQEETWSLLAQAGVEVVTAMDSESAVRAVVRHLASRR